jgi:hypothetical protein
LFLPGTRGAAVLPLYPGSGSCGKIFEIQDTGEIAMTLKQIAERLGVSVKQLDYEFQGVVVFWTYYYKSGYTIPKTL